MSVGNLLACYVDRDSGQPSSGPNKVGHVVLVSDTAAMPVVLEFQDDGVFTHADCGPASLASFLLMNGIKADVRVIEEKAGTSLAGTLFPGLITAAEYYGCSVVDKGGNPPSGYIMNPMLETVQPPSIFAAYAANSQDGYLVLSAKVVPVPAPPVEDSMARSQFVFFRYANAIFVGDFMHVRHIENPTQMTDDINIGTFLEGVPIPDWSSLQPVNDPGAFGVPIGDAIEIIKANPPSVAPDPAS